MHRMPPELLLIVVLTTAVAAWLQPWRMLRGPLLQPALAALVLLAAWQGELSAARRSRIRGGRLA